jgi:hypothetical protein
MFHKSSIWMLHSKKDMMYDNLISGMALRKQNLLTYAQAAPSKYFLVKLSTS